MNHRIDRRSVVVGLRSVVVVLLTLGAVIPIHAQTMGIGQTTLQLGAPLETAQKALTSLGYHLQPTPGTDDVARFVVISDSALVGSIEARKGRVTNITRTLANDEENYTAAYELFLIALQDAQAHGMQHLTTDVRPVELVSGHRCTRLTVHGDGHAVHLYSKDRDGAVLFTVSQEITSK